MLLYAFVHVVNETISYILVDIEKQYTHKCLTKK